MDINQFIRTVPDFPKAGIQFKDISPLIGNGDALRHVVKELAEPFKDKKVEMVLGMESRGFIFGTAVACELGVGFAPVRKPGKLPATTTKVEYELEYGTDALEIHTDAFKPGANVLIVDDLLATGGTADATMQLVSKLGGNLLGFSFVIELDFLKGRERLKDFPVHSLLHVD
jgi:adenine phosphoribosyltransferase